MKMIIKFTNLKIIDNNSKGPKIFKIELIY